MLRLLGGCDESAVDVVGGGVEVGMREPVLRGLYVLADIEELADVMMSLVDEVRDRTMQIRGRMDAMDRNAARATPRRALGQHEGIRHGEELSQGR